MNANTDYIEKVVELDAPLDRVWTALTDHREFGDWFRVALDQPFEEGAESTGRTTYPGCEGPWLAHVERIQAKEYFAFRWHDYDESSTKPVEEQPTTLVEFRLAEAGTGTRLTIRESGFSNLGEGRAIEAMRGNEKGWNIQAENIANHVARG